VDKPRPAQYAQRFEMAGKPRTHVRSLDRIVRAVVPSTPILARSRWLAPAFALAELLPRFCIRLFIRAPLPPGRYIVRIGVGNQIWRPHHWYLTSSTHMWMYYMAEGVVKRDSIVVDIGSGVGRAAVGLRDFGFHGAGFEGHYFGFDVDSEMVDWCRRNFPSERFTFTHLEAHSSIYSPESAARFPVIELGEAQGAADFVFSESLLTHLLEADVVHYLRLGYALLRPGGVLAMTFFCRQYMEEIGALGGRWTFAHRRGSAYVENERYSEAAVAYDRAWMVEACRSVGFTEAHTTLRDFQSTIRAVK